MESTRYGKQPIPVRIAMMNVKLVSVDLFRTLVDLDQSDKLIWKIFLRENYSNSLSKKYWERANEILNKRWDDAAIHDGQFKNVRTVFEETFRDLFDEIHLDFDPKTAADVLVEQHKVHDLFADVKPFLDTVGRKYPLCISTDCDLEMIVNIDELYAFDRVFVSESLRTYKLNPSFFVHVLSHYDLSPENILHIGDAKADIIGPKSLGMLTCWLNRHNHTWNHAIKPDFEVNSLLEVIGILDQV